MGETVWGAYLFSKLDKWRGGERIKFEAETIMWLAWWLVYELGRESEGDNSNSKGVRLLQADFIPISSHALPHPTPPLVRK